MSAERRHGLLAAMFEVGMARNNRIRALGMVIGSVIGLFMTSWIRRRILLLVMSVALISIIVSTMSIEFTTSTIPESTTESNTIYMINFVIFAFITGIPSIIIQVFISMIDNSTESVCHDYAISKLKMYEYIIAFFPIFSGLYFIQNDLLILCSCMTLSASTYLVPLIYFLPFIAVPTGIATIVMLLYISLFIFRVRRGYFGLNVEEATELAWFMASQYSGSNGTPPARTLNSHRVRQRQFETARAFGELA